MRYVRNYRNRFCSGDRTRRLLGDGQEIPIARNMLPYDRLHLVPTLHSGAVMSTSGDVVI